MLQPQGYYILDELLDAVAVSLEFLEAEIEAGHLSPSLTMYGEPWYRQDTVHRWIVKRELEISQEQAKMRKLKAETI